MTQTGRSPSGRLRNFKSMSDQKLVLTLQMVEQEQNDPVALEALRNVASSRGLAAVGPAPTPVEVAGSVVGQYVDPDDSGMADADVRLGVELLSVAPMLCRGADVLPGGDGWLYEPKWDGFRCIAHVMNGTVALRSRSGKSLVFPQIEAVLAELRTPEGDPIDCLLDGEAVVLGDDGMPDFGEMSDGHPHAGLVVFDLLELMGQDVRGVPLETRRELLDELLRRVAGEQHVTLSMATPDGESLYAEMVKRGGEGVVAKRLDSRYAEGQRSPNWLKVKIRLEQEFVVAGWTDGKNGNEGNVGGLLLAVRVDTLDDKPRWRFCGRVGGFETLRDDLEALSIPAVSPYVDGVPTDKTHREAHFVLPQLVVRVEFQKWTADGRLWHPVLKGVDPDKQSADVWRQT